MARNSKLTDEMIENFCRAQQLGLSVKASCDYCGITDRAYYKYIEKAKEDMEKGLKTKYVQFFHKVKKASADFRAYHMLKIREASESGTWQASAWLLERCYPEEYGRSMKNDVVAENGILPQLISAIQEKKGRNEN